jgi:hypothetical protein
LQQPQTTTIGHHSHTKAKKTIHQRSPPQYAENKKNKPKKMLAPWCVFFLAVTAIKIGTTTATTLLQNTTFNTSDCTGPFEIVSQNEVVYIEDECFDYDVKKSFRIFQDDPPVPTTYLVNFFSTTNCSGEYEAESKATVGNACNTNTQGNVTTSTAYQWIDTSYDSSEIAFATEIKSANSSIPLTGCPDWSARDPLEIERQAFNFLPQVCHPRVFGTNTSMMAIDRNEIRSFNTTDCTGEYNNVADECTKRDSSEFVVFFGNPLNENSLASNTSTATPSPSTNSSTPTPSSNETEPQSVWVFGASTFTTGTCDSEPTAVGAARTYTVEGVCAGDEQGQRLFDDSSFASPKSVRVFRTDPSSYFSGYVRMYYGDKFCTDEEFLGNETMAPFSSCPGVADSLVVAWSEIPYPASMLPVLNTGEDGAFPLNCTVAIDGYYRLNQGAYLPDTCITNVGFIDGFLSFRKSNATGRMFGFTDGNCEQNSTLVEPNQCFYTLGSQRIHSFGSFDTRMGDMVETLLDNPGRGPTLAPTLRPITLPPTASRDDDVNSTWVFTGIKFDSTSCENDPVVDTKYPSSTINVEGACHRVKSPYTVRVDGGGPRVVTGSLKYYRSTPSPTSYFSERDTMYFFDDDCNDFAGNTTTNFQKSCPTNLAVDAYGWVKVNYTISQFPVVSIMRMDTESSASFPVTCDQPVTDDFYVFSQFTFMPDWCRPTAAIQGFGSVKRESDTGDIVAYTDDLCQVNKVYQDNNFCAVHQHIDGGVISIGSFGAKAGDIVRLTQPAPPTVWAVGAVKFPTDTCDTKPTALGAANTYIVEGVCIGDEYGPRRFNGTTTASPRSVRVFRTDPSSQFSDGAVYMYYEDKFCTKAQFLGNVTYTDSSLGCPGVANRTTVAWLEIPYPATNFAVLSTAEQQGSAGLPVNCSVATERRFLFSQGAYLPDTCISNVGFIDGFLSFRKSNATGRLSGFTDAECQEGSTFVEPNQCFYTLGSQRIHSFGSFETRIVDMVQTLLEEPVELEGTPVPTTSIPTYDPTFAPTEPPVWALGPVNYVTWDCSDVGTMLPTSRVVVEHACTMQRPQKYVLLDQNTTRFNITIAANNTVLYAGGDLISYVAYRTPPGQYGGYGTIKEYYTDRYCNGTMVGSRLIEQATCSGAGATSFGWSQLPFQLSEMVAVSSVSLPEPSTTLRLLSDFGEMMGMAGGNASTVNLTCSNFADPKLVFTSSFVLPGGCHSLDDFDVEGIVSFKATSPGEVIGYPNPDCAGRAENITDACLESNDGESIFVIGNPQSFENNVVLPDPTAVITDQPTPQPTQRPTYPPNTGLNGTGIDFGSGGEQSAFGGSFLFVMILSGSSVVFYNNGGLFLHLIPRVPKGCKHHFFLSHMQRETGDRMHILYHILFHYVGVKVWYDQEMERLGARDMQLGVDESAVVLMFLSKSLFDREFVIIEIEQAFAKDKPVMLIEDPEQAGTSIAFDKSNYSIHGSATEETVEKIRVLVEQEVITLGRDKKEMQAMVYKLMKRFRGRSKFVVELPPEDEYEVAEEVHPGRSLMTSNPSFIKC